MCCADTNKQILNEVKLDTNLIEICQNELSETLHYLLQTNPWKGINNKIFDFILCICQANNVETDIKNTFEGNKTEIFFF